MGPSHKPREIQGDSQSQPGSKCPSLILAQRSPLPLGEISLGKATPSLGKTSGEEEGQAFNQPQ